MIVLCYHTSWEKLFFVEYNPAFLSKTCLEDHFILFFFVFLRKAHVNHIFLWSFIFNVFPKVLARTFFFFFFSRQNILQENLSYQFEFLNLTQFKVSLYLFHLSSYCFNFWICKSLKNQLYPWNTIDGLLS